MQTNQMKVPGLAPARTKLADPYGLIHRVKVRMKPNCSTRMSPFCEVIISMRMQGVSCDNVEKWLVDQGEEYRIPAATIWRNLKDCAVEVSLPYAEELAEKWGGRMDMDLVRELGGQVLLQRQRVDAMSRQEAEARAENPRWFNHFILKERELLRILIKDLHNMMMEQLKQDQDLPPEHMASAMGDMLAQIKDLDPKVVATLAELIIGNHLNPLLEVKALNP